MSAAGPAAAAASAAASFPWAAVLTTIVGSGVTAAVVQSAITAFGAGRERWRLGRDTALRAAAPLEAFARGAADAAYQSKRYDLHDDHGEPLRSIPSPPDLKTLDWKPVPQELAARAFGFEQVATIAKEYVTGAFDADDDLGLQEHHRQGVRLGRMAWRIAADLRREYRLPPPDTRIAHYDFAESLEEMQRVIDKELVELRALTDQ